MHVLRLSFVLDWVMRLMDAARLLYHNILVDDVVEFEVVTALRQPLRMLKLFWNALPVGQIKLLVVHAVHFVEDAVLMAHVLHESRHYTLSLLVCLTDDQVLVLHARLNSITGHVRRVLDLLERALVLLCH